MGKFATILCQFVAKAAQSLALALFVLLVSMPTLQAQTPQLSTPSQSEAESADSIQKKRIFETKARAADARTLKAGKNVVRLWGVERVEGGSAPFKLLARTSLDNLIGSRNIQCELMGKPNGSIPAQCSSGDGVDLSLYMIQQGYVVVDRSLVYGTLFEAPYLEAEQRAQELALGIWAEEAGASSASAGKVSNKLIILVLVLLVLLIAGLGVVSRLLLQGFQQVIRSQDRNTESLDRARQLKAQERGIVASMLESELKANKTKIEAYLVIYEEMLKSLQDPAQIPKYQKSGDMVQLQPALERAIFDGNNDKMDILGRKLSSGVIHLYARVKTNPDYVNLDTGTPMQEAISHVEKAVQSARILDKLLIKLLDVFAQNGIGKE